MISIAQLADTLLGRAPHGPPRDRLWRVWDLDSELRYRPVVESFPSSPLPICEVGSGPQGIAAWTNRTIVGVDPGADDKHASATAAPANFQRVVGDGANIPLPDRSVAAAIAVDTFEHIPAAARAAVVREMERVTADGGRIILMGPTGPDAATGDHYVLERWRERGDDTNIVTWLSEHEQIGVPSVEELASLLNTGRVTKVKAVGVYNLGMWRAMHRALLGDFVKPRGDRFLHHLLWAPFAFVARRYRRGPFYRQLLVAEVGAGANGD